MKINIEIETNEPLPDIADLVSTVVREVVKTHGKDNGDIRLDSPSVDDPLHARFEVSDVTRGSMRYAPEDPGPEYSLTFTLETAP